MKSLEIPSPPPPQGYSEGQSTTELFDVENTVHVLRVR